MGLDRRAFGRLRDAASGFTTKNHAGYLAEALQCVRETCDPIAALKLLAAMWGSSYAGRDDQMHALNDVGRWLEARLYRDPHVSAEAVALDLGWLRRLARIATAACGSAERARQGHSARLVRTFGDRERVRRLEERRHEVRPALHPRRAPQSAAPPDPPRPDRLPAMFEAEFVDFPAARDARRTARERAKRGKPAKDRLLAVRPTDARLHPLAVGLVCSVLHTEGIEAVFEASQRKGGAACTFFVIAMEAREGQRFVRVISLEPPE